jgi:predicted solute-binding protein
MVIVFELNEKLLGDIEKDISKFLNGVIDISNVPSTVASHLNLEIAKRFGVTPKELSIQLIENHFRELALKANIDVVCVVKEQIEKEPDIINKLRVGRIILLK